MEYLKLLDPKTKKSRVYADMVKAFALESDSNFYCMPELHNCYIKPSEIKQDVYRHCIDFCQKYVKARNANGGNYRIKDYGVISYNAHFFTFACVVGVYAITPQNFGNWLFDTAVIITKSKMFEIIL